MEKEELFLNCTFEDKSLINWVKSKNPDLTYHYVSNAECILSQYFRDKLANSTHDVCVGTNTGFVTNENNSIICIFDIPSNWDEWSHYSKDIILPAVRTFGGFLQNIGV